MNTKWAIVENMGKGFYVETLADTLAAAIRDAGVRCETCKHYYQVGKDGDIGECGADWRDTGSGGESTKPHFFCHNHTLLTQPSEGKG